jgi:hypothetical protein
MSPIFPISRIRPQGIKVCNLSALAPNAPAIDLPALAESPSALADALLQSLQELRKLDNQFDCAFLCGGLASLHGLREATESFPIPVHLAVEPQFISLSAAPVLRESLGIGSYQPLWIVDIGRSHLKISLHSRYTTRCVFKRPTRLPLLQPAELAPDAPVDLTQESLNWLTDCFAQIRVRTEPRCHLVVGLPCDVSDTLDLCACSYPGWDTPKAFGNTIVAAIGHAIFSQGCLVQTAAILNDIELAACGALAQLSKEGTTYHNALVMSLGLNPHAAILGRSVPRHAYDSD